MNNTILNVSRELLADLLGNDHDKRIMAERHLLAMLANAPLPTGVDGLVAVKVWEADADWDDHELVVMLSDAQAVIDGLRGEVERLQRAENNDAIAYKAALERQDELRTERDQQAQRIAELEGLLRAAGEAGRQLSNAAYNLAQREGHELTKCECALLSSLRKQWDAALSTGKDGE